MFGKGRDGAPPSGFSSTTWRASAVIVGIIAILLVGVLIAVSTGHGGKHDDAAPAPQTSSAPSTAPAAGAAPDAGRPAGCATTGTDQTIPTGPPAGVTWSLASGVAVPGRAADGPALRGGGGVGYCFSHTPVGALLAAANLGQGTGSDQDVEAAVNEHSLVNNEFTPPVGQDDTGGPKPTGVQLAGFRIIAYNDQQASIALAYAVAATPGSYPELTLAMQWDQGDWRGVPQAGPSIAATRTTASSLNGFVGWSGVA